MPVWQPRSDWLRAAIGSALDDQEFPLELIVVDDGCDEPVEDLLGEVEDHRLRVLRVDHGGPYAARNAGLRVATSAYVRFVDADDIVEPGSTRRLLDLAGGRENVLAYGATLMCDEMLEPQRIVTSTLEGDVAKVCVQGGFDVYVVSILFPRTVIDRAGLWEESQFRVSGDWDFVLRCLEQASVRRLDEIVTRYRRHGGSITRNADVAAGAEAGKLVLDRYFARNPEQRKTPLARRAYSRLHIDRANEHAWRGNYRRAVAELVEGARFAPGRALFAVGGFLVQRAPRIISAAARHVRRARRRPA